MQSRQSLKAKLSLALSTITAFSMLLVFCRASEAQMAYTQSWQLTPKLEHGFVVGHPRDWNVLDLPSQTIRFEAPVSTASGSRISCGVTFLPQTGSQQTQRQSDIDLEVNRAPLSEAEAIALLARFRTMGLNPTVINLSRDRAAGHPVHVVEFETTIPHREGDIHIRTLVGYLNTPRQRFTLDCSVTARSNGDGDRLYIRWLPVFRAFLETFTLFPRSQ